VEEEIVIKLRAVMFACSPRTKTRRVQLGTLMAVFLMQLTVCACARRSSNWPIDASLKQEPLVAKTPLRVGLYYERTAILQGTLAITGGNPLPMRKDDFVPPLDEGSVQLVHDALSGLFSEVIELDHWPLEPDSQPSLAGAIRLDIREFFARWGEMSQYFTILYELELVDPNQGPVCSWIVQGTGATERSWWGLSGSRRSFGAAATAAMKDAIATFMIGFRERSEVQDWLAGHGVTGD
jgi:hypothetical protein